MKARALLFALAFGFIALIVKGQNFNLNDLIQCHKKNVQELNYFLKLKSSGWLFHGHDDDRNWWEYYEGSISSILYKTDGGTDESEIMLITNNTRVIKTIFDDVKKSNMKSIDNKAMYLGSNYFVFFKDVTDDKGETVWKISLSTKTSYLNWKEKFNK